MHDAAYRPSTIGLTMGHDRPWHTSRTAQAPHSFAPRSSHLNGYRISNVPVVLLHGVAVRFFSRALLVLTFCIFSAYVVHVEPNAADDPLGAASRAVSRLSTTCDRNQDLCSFVGTSWQRMEQLGRVGAGLASGQGRLVYVEDAHAGRSSGDWTRSGSSNSLGDQFAGVLEGPGASGGHERASSGHACR